MVSTAAGAGRSFRHDAVLYAGDDEFVDTVAPFVRDGVEAGEPVLVVVAAPKITRLRTALGTHADAVQFADMAEVGANPGRILPAWRDFLDDRGGEGRPVRGVGEPIGPARRAAELLECQRHESLLNVAFADAPALWLQCPYDTEALDPLVVDEARRTHPYVVDHGAECRSTQYLGVEASLARYDGPLPAPPPDAASVAFDGRSLGVVRRAVTRDAAALGLGPDRVQDLVIAVNEVVSNSIRHGGGGGELRMWEDGGAVLCEVRDGGRLDDPLAGRRRPPAGDEGGRGLWLVQQLCDLVQVRDDGGCVVRLHVNR